MREKKKKEEFIFRYFLEFNVLELTLLSKKKKQRRRGDRRRPRPTTLPTRNVGNTQISILLLCFLYLFVELMITMNEYNFVSTKFSKRGKQDDNVNVTHW